MPSDMTMSDATAPLSDVRVLLVEDEAFIAMAIIDKLLEAGAKCVDHALTLAEAYDVLKSESYDAAILDLRLPDGNAEELAHELVKDATPIVFHSGHAEIDMLRARFPAAKICHKPCLHSAFVTAIQELLAN